MRIVQVKCNNCEKVIIDNGIWDSDGPEAKITINTDVRMMSGDFCGKCMKKLIKLLEQFKFDVELEGVSDD